MTLVAQARQLRAALNRAPKTAATGAHRQMAGRRIADVLLLAGRNDHAAEIRLAEARFHAQHVIDA